MRLKENIVSCKGGTTYGYRGDEVIVISKRGNAVIVQGKSGERFSVRNDQLGSAEVEGNKIESIPDTVDSKAKNKSRLPGIKIKPESINQKKLFQ